LFTNFYPSSLVAPLFPPPPSPPRDRVRRPPFPFLPAPLVGLAHARSIPFRLFSGQLCMGIEYAGHSNCILAQLHWIPFFSPPICRGCPPFSCSRTAAPWHVCWPLSPTFFCPSPLPFAFRLVLLTPPLPIYPPHIFLG